MLGFTLLLVPILSTRKRVTRREGAFLLACYAAYTVYRVISDQAPL